VFRGKKKINRVKRDTSIKKKGLKKRKAFRLINGVNLMGYSRSENGLGEGCRLLAKAMRRKDIRFRIFNIADPITRMQDLSWKHRERKKAFHKINLIHVNGDYMKRAHKYIGARNFK